MTEYKNLPCPVGRALSSNKPHLSTLPIAEPKTEFFMIGN
jgi:hypothetical protein